MGKTKTTSAFLSSSRRDFFRIGAAGAGMLAAPAIMTRAAFAQSDQPDVAAGEANARAAGDGEGFVRYALGDFEIFVFSDGQQAVDDPGSVFGTDQSQEDVSSLLRANYLPTGRMVLGYQPTVIRRGSDVVLFDTGNENTAGSQTGNLTANMRMAGIAPDDVTHVVFTHLHPDHIGGTTTRGGEETFANAEYFVNQTEYDWWTSDDRVGTAAENAHRLVMNKVAPLAEKITFIGDGDAPVSGVTAINAFGHTPGHTIFRIATGPQDVILSADTSNHFVLSLQRPDWEVVFDVDKAQAAATRKEVFGMLASERLPFIAYHFPFPSTGYVEAMDQGFRFIPESYQLALAGSEGGN